MGRPGLTQHRKFRRLARTLGSALVARGAVEFMWDTCYENGDEFLGDSADVEAAARWDGEPGRLTKALLDAGGGDGPGFIEEVRGRSGRYMVHDFWHHVPDYVRKRRAREHERRRKSDPVVPTAPDATMTSQSPPNDGHWTPSPDCWDGVVLPPHPHPHPHPHPIKPYRRNQKVSTRHWRKSGITTWRNWERTVTSIALRTNAAAKGKARLEECLRMAAEPKLENAVAMMKVCIDRLAASTFHNGRQPGGPEVCGLERSPVSE